MHVVVGCKVRSACAEGRGRASSPRAIRWVGGDGVCYEFPAAEVGMVGEECSRSCA